MYCIKVRDHSPISFHPVRYSRRYETKSSALKALAGSIGAMKRNAMRGAYGGYADGDEITPYETTVYLCEWAPNPSDRYAYEARPYTWVAIRKGRIDRRGRLTWEAEEGEERFAA